MKVFLSWAGEQSRHIAQTLYTWLPQVIQSIEPWYSPRMNKGDAWDGAIEEGLSDTKIGIIILTPESLESKYLHYEAGAISNVKGSQTCTLLIGLKPTDVKQPLGRFQHTKSDAEDILALLRTINSKLIEVGEKPLLEEKLSKAFNLNWPELKFAIEQLPPVEQKANPRTMQDMLEEILTTVRSGFDKLNQSSRVKLFDEPYPPGTTRRTQAILNYIKKNNSDDSLDRPDITETFQEIVSEETIKDTLLWYLYGKVSVEQLSDALRETKNHLGRERPVKT